jgi:hypothetical protein
LHYKFSLATILKKHNPLRMAVSEKQALNKIFQTVSAEVKAQECTRAILVGHNAFFDPEIGLNLKLLALFNPDKV